MEAPSPFQFPPRQGSPLRTLSPERVNSRPASVASNDRKISDTGSPEPREIQSSPMRTAETQSSPTRKANLFADYHPVTRSSSRSKEVFGGGVPQSSSLPEFTSLRTHGRTNSDVQGLVKRFEHLDVRDRDAESEARRKKQEMELRRAQLGREEAESELKRWKEECRRIAEDLKESRHRESKVSNRLEKVMDDYRQAKSEYSSNAEAYAKEVRKARKEAFKSSSSVLKLQETLRDTQKRLQVSKIDHATDVQKADRFEQEATESKCALMAMQQDLNRLREQFQVLEQEKEALKTNLKEEEVARIAAEGQIALPAAQEDDEDLFSSPNKPSSPRKLPRSPLSDDKENVGVMTKKMFDSRRLQEEVDFERQKKEAAEEMVEFLQMECAFKCCECASASRHGRAFRVSMDEILASSIQRMKTDIATILSPPESENGEDRMQVEQQTPDAAAGAPASPRREDSQQPVDHIMQEDDDDTLAPKEDLSVTLAGDDTHTLAEEEPPQAPHPTPALDEQMNEQTLVHHEDTTEAQNDDLEDDDKHSEAHAAITIPLKDSPPSTPPRAQQNSEGEGQCPNSVRTVTTTTRIPMHFTPVSKPAMIPHFERENCPPLGNQADDCAVEEISSELPFDREAALAAIAYRRGRARSIANGTLTPRKQMLEGVNVSGRRDISAPVIGAKGYHQKANSVGHSAGKALRS